MNEIHVFCFKSLILVNKIRIKCKTMFEFNLSFKKVETFWYFVVRETGWSYTLEYVLSVFSQNYSDK